MSTNLVRYWSKNNFVESNNFRELLSSMMNSTTNILAINLSLNNYFDSPTKLFSVLYLTKFLNISAKLFFLYVIDINSILSKTLLYKGKN